jgi:hypothetical protein
LTPDKKFSYFINDSLEGKMAVDPLKNKMMIDKNTHFRSKSFFWCSRNKSVDRSKWTELLFFFLIIIILSFSFLSATWVAFKQSGISKKHSHVSDQTSNLHTQ